MNLDMVLFGYYPYVAAVIFLVGSLVTLRQSLASWRSGTAELCHIGPISWPSRLFHVAIFALFVGHAAGMLIPPRIYQAAGLSTSAKQHFAVITGGSFGWLCLAGLLYYLHRRLTSPEKRATGTKMDMIVLLFLGLELILGLMTLPISWARHDGSLMLILSHWARSIVSFEPGAAHVMVDVPWIFKLHLLVGISFFVLIPFSHLVHMWTVPLRYLLHPDQFVWQQEVSK